MSSILCITFRFIQPFPLFHGRGDADRPEWPPSPMRAFQALVNAASLRARGRALTTEVRQALQTLEALRPNIVAPRATVSTVGYRAYVPHNQTDLVTAAWHRGNLDASIAEYRMEKDFRPMRIEMIGDELPTLRYLYPLEMMTLDSDVLLRAIRPSVRAITHLGWGIDQVIADAILIDQSSPLLTGERWMPSARAGRHLRVHRNGSLDALTKRHDQFLTRLQDGWTPVSPLSAFDRVRYHCDTDPLPRPHAIFKLLDDNEDTARYPHARLAHIAGMVRHVAIERMKGDPPPWVENPADWVNRVVRGKRDESVGNDHRQFSYVPLPSIGHAHSDAIIRNVMIIAPIGMERELKFLADRIDRELLKREGEFEDCKTDSTPVSGFKAELRRFTPPSGKFIDKHYLGTSSIWQTVTPMILPGHNDKKAAKSVKLIQTALQQSGIVTPCDFSWQSVPFLKNCLSAHKYDRNGRHAGYHRPTRLKDLTAVHVQLTFDRPIPGPLTLGAGRHCGFGLMAAVSD
ncbi:MAG: type I-U CRISPR-associated protein Cas5/Cas6 [Pirellulales bacterium]|nr:type I-U CRISPR-associated protein Cas5/Cas6 [Pirellulales bacterium]